MIGSGGPIVLPRGLPVPGKEFVQPILRRLGDPAENVGEPGLGIDVVEPGGADQRVHDRRTHAAAVGAGEQPTASSERDTTKRALRGIVCQAEPAVVKEAREGVSSLQHVVHRPGHGTVARELRTLGPHPRLQLGDKRRAALAAHRETMPGGLAVDLAFDVEQRIDPRHGLQRQRRDRRRVLAAMSASS